MKMAKWSSEEFQEVSEVSCESKRLVCLSPLDSPCIHCFFLNLSDSFSFALLSSDAVSLCFRFRSLARSRLDCSCSISALAQSFPHVDRLVDQYHVAPAPFRLLHDLRSPPGRTSTTWLVVWGQDHRNHAHAIEV